MRLSQYLENKGLNYKQFSEMLGVTETSVYRYAAGLRIPRPEQINSITQLTDGAVTANDFYAPPLDQGMDQSNTQQGA